MHRGLAFLPALSLLAACGTFRAYEGPELPREDVARITENFDGHGRVPFDFMAVEILAVDDVSIADHSGRTVEVLPGSHTLEVQGRMTIPFADIHEFPHGRISFDARAGGRYDFDLITTGPGSHTTAIILLCDSDTATALGDTAPPVELARTATIDFGGSPWPVVDWSRTDQVAWPRTDLSRTFTSASMTWIPPGQTLDDWQEKIEAQAYEPTDPDSIYDPVNLRVLATVERWEMSDPPIAWSEHPTATAWRLLEYHDPGGEHRPGERGIVMLRGAGDRVHVLVYATRSEATLQADAARWEAAFQQAELAFPTY
ncbi:MAG TPA: hypothetical protein VFY71_09995 [Planctomycetota bacterium]|nr:hypothetical protein [Planctomycetota bacterium]